MLMYLFTNMDVGTYMLIYIQILPDLNQKTLTVGGSITVQQLSSLTRLELTKEENLVFFVPL